MTGGDGVWTGGASYLTFTATGDVAPITIGGRLHVTAGDDIGDLTAQTISATAAGDIGNLTAAAKGSAWTTGGNIADVTATTVIGAIAEQGSVGHVNASGNVMVVGGQYVLLP